MTVTVADLNRLRGHAIRIGVLVNIEPVAAGWRVLIDSRADHNFHGAIVGYIEEEMRLRTVLDLEPWQEPWQSLVVITGVKGAPMASDLSEEQQTNLAAEVVTLFHRANLTAPQARSLLDEVRILVDAAEMGLFKQSQ